jgi:hypothetical protein
MNNVLNWKEIDGYQEAVLGSWPEDGVRFSLERYPSCYRRGRHRLLIEVCGGPKHYAWGCLDESDQPMRHYHSEDNAKSEANLIARVLWEDRWKGVTP